MSKRSTPAQSASAKRAAFAGQRQKLSASRKHKSPTTRVNVRLAEANFHGNLMKLLSQLDQGFNLISCRSA